MKKIKSTIKNFLNYYKLTRTTILFGLLAYLTSVLGKKIWEGDMDKPFWIAVLAFVVVGVFVLRPFFRYQTKNHVLLDEVVYLEINPIAEKFAQINNHNGLIVGSVIEIMVHPMISSKADISDIGWNPEDVRIKLDEKKPDFNVNAIYNSLDRQAPTQTESFKYCLAEEKQVTKDDCILDYLIFQRTDYLIVKEISQLIPSKPLLRQDLGSLNPVKHQLPNSFCLHYVIEFSDGSVLLLKRRDSLERRDSLDYYPNTFSISGEEQISEVDFRTGNLLNLFKRALIEEVFPLVVKHKNLDTENEQINKMYKKINEYIAIQKVFSLLYEEEIANFAIMGYFLFNIPIKDFKDLSSKFLAEGNHRDNEGFLYYTSWKNLMLLHFTHKCQVYSLRDGQESSLLKSDLHPTSSYRLFRFLRIKNDGDLTFDNFSKTYHAGFEVY